MKIYTADDVLTVAKRLNNARRNFLLVNPLQGKHLPVRPTAALNMMHALGQTVAKKFPAARLVIGFAETATAIGAVVAKNLSDECFYLQTTRETFAGTFVEFLEEPMWLITSHQIFSLRGHLRGIFGGTQSRARTKTFCRKFCHNAQSNARSCLCRR